MEQVDKGNIYLGLVELVNGAEAVSWARFNNYLLFNSVLLLAWATLVAGQPFPLRGWVLALICGVGMVGGFLWAILGWRGRSFHNLYIGIGEAFEKKYFAEVDRDLRVFVRTEEHRKKLSLSEVFGGTDFRFMDIGSSFVMLGCLPLLGMVMYVALLVIGTAI